MSSHVPANKAGWVWHFESPPSLCRHYMPVSGHKLSNTCYCKPLIQNEPTYTVVIHHA